MKHLSKQRKGKEVSTRMLMRMYANSLRILHSHIIRKNSQMHLCAIHSLSSGERRGIVLYFTNPINLAARILSRFAARGAMRTSWYVSDEQQRSWSKCARPYGKRKNDRCLCCSSSTYSSSTTSSSRRGINSFLPLPNLMAFVK